jgi:hypothetical protein
MLLIILTACSEPQPSAPYGLLCELLRQPEAAVITDRNPEFSWIGNDDRRGDFQTAYQFLVSNSDGNLRKNTGDLWDSGKVTAETSSNIEYTGKNLLENTPYWWKVRTWDEHDQVSPYSDIQMFRTGTFGDHDRDWPGESKWVKVDDRWLLENRQRADYHEIEPVELKKLSDGHYFIDFGKAAFATLRIEFTAAASDDSVTLYLGERRTENFHVHKDPGYSNIGFKKINKIMTIA